MLEIKCRYKGKDRVVIENNEQIVFNVVEKIIPYLDSLGNTKGTLKLTGGIDVTFFRKTIHLLSSHCKLNNLTLDLSDLVVRNVTFKNRISFCFSSSCVFDEIILPKNTTTIFAKRGFKCLNANKITLAENIQVDDIVGGFFDDSNCDILDLRNMSLSQGVCFSQFLCYCNIKKLLLPDNFEVRFRDHLVISDTKIEETTKSLVFCSSNNTKYRTYIEFTDAEIGGEVIVKSSSKMNMILESCKIDRFSIQNKEHESAIILRGNTKNTNVFCNSRQVFFSVEEKKIQDIENNTFHLCNIEELKEEDFKNLLQLNDTNRIFLSKEYTKEEK